MAAPNPVLVESFQRLLPGEKVRLRRHAKAGTRICCGMDAYVFADGIGGG